MDEAGQNLTLDQLLSLLACGKMELIGQFVRGSNTTLLVQLKEGSHQIRAVYKPVKGEYPLFDFPDRTLAKRETAAYLLSEWLGWQLVPPTVFRKSGLLGAGSLQFYIDHDPNTHYFSMTASERQRLKPVALFDVMVNNADRKGSHIVFDRSGKIWVIDHGVCFHVEEKLRTVIWDFEGEEIPAHLLADLERAQSGLKRGGELFECLHVYLSIAELLALEQRIRILLKTRTYPLLPADRCAIPYPPL